MVHPCVAFCDLRAAVSLWPSSRGGISTERELGSGLSLAGDRRVCIVGLCRLRAAASR
ncbi:MAG: hypothetical protein JNJ46_04865 [Myxococcales bacterium]|nr:hypothetical protein [Myxococcales bacterium]